MNLTRVWDMVIGAALFLGLFLFLFSLGLLILTL